MSDDIGKRCLGDEAEIAGAGCGVSRLGFEFVADLVQVDLLPAEFQRLAAFREGFDRHAEDAGIEIAGGRDIGDGQHEMVETVYADHAFLLANCWAKQAEAKASASMASVKITTAAQPSTA